MVRPGLVRLRSTARASRRACGSSAPWARPGRSARDRGSARWRWPAAAAGRRRGRSTRVSAASVSSDQAAAPARPPAAEAVERRDRLQVLARGQPGEERRVLGLHADAREQRHVARPRRLAEDGTDARVGSAGPSAISTSVVLPAPLGPSRPKNSPAPTVEGHPVDGPHVAVALAQVVNDDGRAHGGHVCRESTHGTTLHLVPTGLGVVPTGLVVPPMRAPSSQR